VTFLLPMNEEGERLRNPFHQFTKRRKNRAGTRFMMACHRVLRVDDDGLMENCRQAIYEDEGMLAGGNVSQTTGLTVKRWLTSDELGHPFEGCERNHDEFVISLVELDDDQQTIDQKVRDRVEKTSTAPSQRTSYVAAMLCKNEGFWTYLEETKGIDIDEATAESQAREYILDVVDIESRAQLDMNSKLRDRFHDKVRTPFLRWQGEY